MTLTIDHQNHFRKTTGRTQAPLRLGRGRGEEHRGVSRAVENARTSLGPNGMNEDGHQPLGEIIRDVGCGGDHERVRSRAPGGTSGGDGSGSAGKGSGRRDELCGVVRGELLGLAEELIWDGLHPRRNQRRVPESVGEVLGMVEGRVSDRRKRDNEFER